MTGDFTRHPPPPAWKKRAPRGFGSGGPEDDRVTPYRQISVNIFGAPARRVSYKYEYLRTVIWPHFAHRVTLRRGLGFGSGQWQALPSSAIRGFEPGGVRAGQ
jgi:hypothetical protein